MSIWNVAKLHAVVSALLGIRAWQRSAVDSTCFLQENMSLKDLRWALRNTTHNGFPVVRDTQHGQVCTCAFTSADFLWHSHQVLVYILSTLCKSQARHVTAHKIWQGACCFCDCRCSWVWS